jgi:hypothetical protein
MEFANRQQKILKALVWKISGPTALEFVQLFVSFLPATFCSSISAAVFDYATYQTELVVANHAFVKLKPSIVGMATTLHGKDPECHEGHRLNLASAESASQLC